MSIFSASFDIASALSSIARVKGVLSSKAIAQIMVTSAESKVIPAVRREVTANKSIFEGNLFRSLSARVRSGALGGHSVEIGTFGVFYGLNIEKGTPAGLPIPVSDKLVRWARIKLGASSPVSAAKSVAMSISRRGSPARPFLQPGWDKSRGEYKADVCRRIASKLGTS